VFAQKSAGIGETSKKQLAVVRLVYTIYKEEKIAVKHAGESLPQTTIHNRQTGITLPKPVLKQKAPGSAGNVGRVCPAKEVRQQTGIVHGPLLQRSGAQPGSHIDAAGNKQRVEQGPHKVRPGDVSAVVEMHMHVGKRHLVGVVQGKTVAVSVGVLHARSQHLVGKKVSVLRIDRGEVHLHIGNLGAVGQTRIVLGEGLGLGVILVVGIISILQQQGGRLLVLVGWHQKVDIAHDALAGVGIETIHQIGHTLEVDGCDAGTRQQVVDTLRLTENFAVAVDIHLPKLPQVVGQSGRHIAQQAGIAQPAVERQHNKVIAGQTDIVVPIKTGLAYLPLHLCPRLRMEGDG